MKARLLYFIFVVAAIAAGLASRAYQEYLPLFVSRHFGDALWAVMIYFGLRMLLPRYRLLHSFGLALLLCFSIEFSQLYQAEWIHHIRSTTLGALVLGKGFLFIDLVRYTAGIIAAWLLDRYLLKVQQQM